MILADQYPIQRKRMVMGFFIASTSLGYALSLIISGVAFPIGGYKLSFLLTCLGPPIGAILGWITLIRTKVLVVKRPEQRGFIKKVVRNRPAMLLIGGYSFHSWELLGMWAWTPAFLASCLVSSGVQGLKAVGMGSYLNALFHVVGLIASFSMGILSDRLGRARVILMLSGLSAVCSFVFGWSIGQPLFLIVMIGLIYAFSALGDSPVLSAALTEVVESSYLGAAFGLRSLLGFCAGALSPLVFGAILDCANLITMEKQYTSWGWAYSILGLGGFCAVASAYIFCVIQTKNKTRVKKVN
jgi:MFS family permease